METPALLLWLVGWGEGDGLMEPEINIPKEISSPYLSVMCSAIQVFHGIVMLIASFP